MFVRQVRDRLPSFLTLPALVSHYRGAGGAGSRGEDGQGGGHTGGGAQGMPGGAGAEARVKGFQGGATTSLSLATPLYRSALSIGYYHYQRY